MHNSPLNALVLISIEVMNTSFVLIVLIRTAKNVILAPIYVQIAIKVTELLMESVRRNAILNVRIAPEQANFNV